MPIVPKVAENGEKSIENAIIENRFLHQNTSGGQVWEYMTGTEVGELMGDSIKAVFEVGTGCVVTEIVEETIEYAIAVRDEEQKEETKTAIWNMVKVALIDIVKWGIGIFLVRVVDMLAK